MFITQSRFALNQRTMLRCTMFTGAMLLATFAATLIVPTVVQAATTTLSAVQDTYLTDKPTSGRDDTNDGNGVRIANVDSGSDRTIGLVQFDLSSVVGEIVSAHMEYYDLGTGPNQSSAFTTENYMVTPALGATDPQLTVLNSGSAVAFNELGMHEEFATYNSYVAATGGFWVEGGASMALALDADNAADMWYSTTDADATDLATINLSKDDKGYVLVLGWRLSGGRLFDDAEGGHAPRLVVETVNIPEPASAALLALGLVGTILSFGRRRK